MAARSLVERLLQSATQIGSLVEHFQYVKELSEDAEFDADYFLETLTKTLKKLQRVVTLEFSSCLKERIS